MKKIQKTKITLQSEEIKIEGETTLYFAIDYKTKGIKLFSPNFSSVEYFRPLVDFGSIENQEKFLKTYSLGIEICKKKLKENKNA